MAERLMRGGGSGSAAPLAEEGGLGRSPGDLLRAGRDQALDEARAALLEIAEDQRRRAAETIGGVAEVLHRTAKDIDSENETMARYTDMAASRLDDLSRTLRQANWNDLVDGAEEFARRQPWWFIGGAVAAGFVAARLLKSTAPVAGAPMAPPAPSPYPPAHGAAADPVMAGHMMAGDAP